MSYIVNSRYKENRYEFLVNEFETCDSRHVLCVQRPSKLNVKCILFLSRERYRIYACCNGVYMETSEGFRTLVELDADMCRYLRLRCAKSVQH
jgi:hypothetical protein